MILQKHDLCHAGYFRNPVWQAYSIHGFSTRLGGISLPPFQFLNTGTNTKDSETSVTTNRDRFFRTLGLTSAQLASPKQTHSDHIVHACKPGIYQDTDALITDMSDIALTIQVADCVPVFLLDPVTPAIGLVHAGWRGSAQEITGKTVQYMNAKLDVIPENIFAGIGPSIGPCCYNVGGEVKTAFESRFFYGDCLDLWEVQRQQLIRAGIPDHQIELSKLCTCCHENWFFSHRASGGKTGRMTGVLRLTSC